MAHCIHSVYGHSGVDRKGKLVSFLYAVFLLILIRKKSFFLLVRCVYLAMYASYIYQKYAQLSSRSGLDSMGIIHFPTFSTVCRFYIFHSLFL